MRKAILMMICGAMLLIVACKSPKVVGSGTPTPDSNTKSAPGKKVPFLQEYYIGNRAYNPAIFAPQYNDEQMQTLPCFLHGTISVIGTIIDQSQRMEGDVTIIDRVEEHHTTLFENGTGMKHIGHNATTSVLRGKIQGEEVPLEFVAGNNGVRWFRPKNGKIKLHGQWFTVTQDSYNAYFEILVDKNFKAKTIKEVAEGVHNEVGTPDNGDQNNSGGDNGQYQYDNNGQNNNIYYYPNDSQNQQPDNQNNGGQPQNNQGQPTTQPATPQNTSPKTIQGMGKKK